MSASEYDTGVGREHPTYSIILIYITKRTPTICKNPLSAVGVLSAHIVDLHFNFIIPIKNICIVKIFSNPHWNKYFVIYEFAL